MVAYIDGQTPMSVMERFEAQIFIGILQYNNDHVCRNNNAYL